MHAKLSLHGGLNEIRKMESLAMAVGSRHQVMSGTQVRVEAAKDAGFSDLDTTLLAAFGREHPPSEQVDQYDSDTEDQQQPEQQFSENLRLQLVADRFANPESNNRDDHRCCRSEQQKGIVHGAD